MAWKFALKCLVPSSELPPLVLIYGSPREVQLQPQPNQSAPDDAKYRCGSLSKLWDYVVKDGLWQQLCTICRTLRVEIHVSSLLQQT